MVLYICGVSCDINQWFLCWFALNFFFFSFNAGFKVNYSLLLGMCSSLSFISAFSRRVVNELWVRTRGVSHAEPSKGCLVLIPNNSLEETPGGILDQSLLNHVSRIASRFPGPLSWSLTKVRVLTPFQERTVVRPVTDHGGRPPMDWLTWLTWWLCQSLNTTIVC